MGELQALATSATQAATASSEMQASSAAAEHSGGLPQLNPQDFAPQLVWLALTFGALYLIMSRIALPRIAGVMEKRQSRISGDLDEAKKLGQKAQDAEAAYTKALAEARTNAQALAQSTRERLSGEVETRRGEAEQKLAARLLDAEQRIAAAKQAAMQDVGTIGAETTREIIRHLIGSEASGDELALAMNRASSH